MVTRNLASKAGTSRMRGVGGMDWWMGLKVVVHELARRPNAFPRRLQITSHFSPGTSVTRNLSRPAVSRPHVTVSQDSFVGG
jgi:hypothetical protein